MICWKISSNEEGNGETFSSMKKVKSLRREERGEGREKLRKLDPLNMKNPSLLNVVDPIGLNVLFERPISKKDPFK